LTFESASSKIFWLLNSGVIRVSVVFWGIRKKSNKILWKLKTFPIFALPKKQVNQFIFRKMYAIVEIAGQQFKVEKKDEIFVHRLEGEPGTKVEFPEVLLIDNDGSVTIGNPHVEGSKITGKIIEHARGDKVIVFKKKRRKGFQKETGHRQDFSKVLIENITHKGAKKEKKASKDAAAEVETA
jgi:large subunit ribosomal protein L21